MVLSGVLHGINDIRYEEFNVPEIAENEVLVKVKCAGICGSDIPRVKTKGTYHFPTVPGHEFAGVIVKKGSQVQNVEIGDRVTVYPLISCRNCSFCKGNKENLCDNYNYLGSRCDGGFAEVVKCPARNVLKFSEEVSFEEAALVEPIAVSLRGVKRGKIKSKDNVVVFGMGPIGLFASQWAKLKGASLVVGVDRNNHKLNIAKEVGIDQAINSNQDDYIEKINEVIGRNGADVVLECSGANVFQELAINIVKKFGIVSIIGNPKKDVSFKSKNFQQILRKEITLIGSWNSLIIPEENEWLEVINTLKEKKIKVLPAITHRFELKNIKQVFDNLYERKIDNYCKGVFLMDGCIK